MACMRYYCVVDTATMERRRVKDRALLVQRFMVLVLYTGRVIIMEMLLQLQREQVFHYLAI